MAGDAGDSASAAVWPTDPAAHLNPRYAITVTDPLSASQQAWAYLYRSPTLTRSNFSYITWNHAAQTASAVSYTAIFSPTRFVGCLTCLSTGECRRPRSTKDPAGNSLYHAQRRKASSPCWEPPLLHCLSPDPCGLPPTAAISKRPFYGSRLDFDVTFNLEESHFRSTQSAPRSIGSVPPSAASTLTMTATRPAALPSMVRRMQ